jgi:hypothetical protein
MIMAAPEDLTNILGPNETIEIYVKQKFYHVKIDIDSIVITNERIILRHPHALGLKKDYTDFNYGDVENVIIDKGIVRSTVKCTLKFGGEPLLLNDLPNADAEKAYGIIRENISRFQMTASPKGTIPEIIFCKFCGAKNKPEDSKCINCGALLK